MPQVSDFIRKLPKAELHLHLEGTVEPDTLMELARRHPEPFRSASSRYKEVYQGDLTNPEVVHNLYQYEDFLGFLMAFKAVSEQMRTPEDYAHVTYRMMERLRREGVLHAEVFVSAGIVHWRGQDFAPIFAGMEEGRIRGERDFGVSVLWIFDAVRHFGVEPAAIVLEDALKLREKFDSVVGFGIGGDERRAEAQLFADVYRRAVGAGLRVTAHAGESAGPESVWGALNIGAERIGHGLHIRQDAELVQVMAERQVPVEICITSNLRTGCCHNLGAHPVREYFDQGLMITLNSDDPAMFGAWIGEEYQRAEKEFGFTQEKLREIARNSFEASFLPAKRKLGYFHLIDGFDDGHKA